MVKELSKRLIGIITLLVVMVATSLSANAADYYLVGSAVGWGSQDYGLTLQDGCYIIDKDFVVGEEFKIRGSGDNGAWLGAPNGSNEITASVLDGVDPVTLTTDGGNPNLVIKVEGHYKIVLDVSGNEYKMLIGVEEPIAVNFDATKGQLSVNKSSAIPGEIVTVTVTPEGGFYIEPSNITVVRTISGGSANAPRLKEDGPGVGGDPIAISGNPTEGVDKTNSYTFVMPEAPFGAKVSAEFQACTTINENMFEAIPTQTYTGHAIEPAVVVKDGVSLTSDDYTVAYSNNTNVTTEENKASVTITGKGKYTGEVTLNFDIVKAPHTIAIDTDIENGNVTTTPAGQAISETVVKVNAVPNADYELDEITVTCETLELLVTVNADSTFIMPEDNVIVSATFNKIPTYTVAGNIKDLFGTEWDTNNTDNDMTLGADGNYTWTSDSTYLDADVEFKVVQDHSWDVSYPEGSNNVKVDIKPGTYILAVTFNRTTKEVTYTLTGQADVYVFGIINDSEKFAADAGYKMTSEDGKTYTAFIEVPAADEGCSFFALTHKLGADSVDWATINKYRFAPQSNGNFVVTGPQMNKELGLVYMSADNTYSLRIPAGNYKLTVNLETMKLTIEGGTDLGYILENGVEGVDYTIIGNLTLVDKDGSSQFFTGDGTNWITLKAGEFYAGAKDYAALLGGTISGKFKDKNLNPYFELSVAPEEADIVPPVAPAIYSLANHFEPQVNEVVTISKAFYNPIENALCAYSPVAGDEGQSLTLDKSFCEYEFESGVRYTVLGVINIKEVWKSEASGIRPKDYDYRWQNYKLVLLDVTGVITGIDDINVEEGVKNVRYYNIAGVESSTPFHGVNIVVKEMNDGSKVTTKAVIK